MRSHKDTVHTKAERNILEAVKVDKKLKAIIVGFYFCFACKLGYLQFHIQMSIMPSALYKKFDNLL